MTRSLAPALKDASSTPLIHDLRIVIDGRIGVTDEMFQQGIAKVQSTKRDRITEVMFIRADGEIISWPF